MIRTDFPEKRAVPRQPSVCSRLSGYIELNRDIFNNPEHSLDRLGEFSHLWIIYHFHKNDSHAKAKVAPPRLGGERVGIFSTRSPHRPCPIGLSLVEIDRIEACRIYFHGTDMVDGTPVLDLKPYIPRYDSPIRTRFTGMWMSQMDLQNQIWVQNFGLFPAKMNTLIFTNVAVIFVFVHRTSIHINRRWESSIWCTRRARRWRNGIKKCPAKCPTDNHITKLSIRHRL